MKSLCGNLDICLNYFANAYFLFMCLWSQAATDGERYFFKSHFSVMRLDRFLDFATEMDFAREKTAHTNAPNMMQSSYFHSHPSP